MQKELIGFWALLALVSSTGCISASEDDPGRDFEFFAEDGKLDELELTIEDPGGDIVTTLPVDRERSGARFAWGGEISRGFFHVVREDLTYSYQNVRNTFELAGAGGGAMGSPVVGDQSADVLYMVPWRVDGTLLAGEDNQADPNLMAYVEVHAEIGFGMQWRGFRPSVGFAVSSVAGRIAPDDEDTDPDDEVDTLLEGVNRGLFLDLKYMPEEYPVYGHIRSITGDYEMTTFGIGFRF